MRILDRERYWAFLKAYIICFVALVGLYVVIDAFSNLDEFGKRADGVSELFKVMSVYYLIHMSQYYDRLCGVIGMMAAIFTVTWMQKNNELLAMLAAGISTQRVIRPVWISTIAVSLIAVFNQEVIMPKYAAELQRSHDDDGTLKVMVRSHYDSNKVVIHGREADRESKTLLPCNVTVPGAILGVMLEIEAKQAHYIPPDHPSAPFTGGWLLRGSRLITPVDEKIFADKEAILVKVDDPKGFPPLYGDKTSLPGDSFFLRSTLDFDSAARSRDWYHYATTPELIQSLSDQSNDKAEKVTIEVFLHSRLLRPLQSLNLMMLSLPLVLGGFGRNMFINLGLSLGTSALFYGVCFVSTYLGDHSVVNPELAAWAPLIGFGSIAVARWGSIRT
ncbi:LptF/LptG family permease [Singulisphaera acidiphila]|uniref:Putative permease n=1 Tax=Singulisphaera acidiphila (strain ATCC BAA-1392 / DSM 18658 / VKM B-2454 / MOB10) TaxID=886293 RepID=L0DCJ2_SINAD|nr:LptF/LptG family permease [Singulisphaera acidiphila]AGA26558.1 putative permease [Singulisphaera acidiphila DSM 18658]